MTGTGTGTGTQTQTQTQTWTTGVTTIALLVLRTGELKTDIFFFFFFFCVVVYGPVNPTGSCRAQSYQTTLLLGRLSPLSGEPVLCTFYHQKLTTTLLESEEATE